MRFLSRSRPEDPVAAQPEPAAGSGKGRPTPTRKEAEARRKQTLRVPSDPKAARKAARARAAEERQASREALMSGDEKHLPRRDAGPVKAFIRDYVDSRWAAAELFLPIAVAVLVLGFLPVPVLQQYVSAGWMFLVLFIGVDTTVLMIRLRRELRSRWPEDGALKGTTFYAIMRVLQLRMLRLPPPRVRIGGRPAKPRRGRAAPAGGGSTK